MGTGSSGLSKKSGGGSGKWASSDSGPFREMTGGEEAEFMRKQEISPELQDAIDRYTDPNEEPGSLYNFSQNMNKALIDGTMTAEQKAVFDEISGAMHNIGYNAQLTRYDHYDTVNAILSQLGVSGDSRDMSVSALKRALVGAEYTDARILSTSVNGFKNAEDPSTFTTRQFKFSYLTKPTAQVLMPGVGKTAHRRSGRSSGDDFGEMLLASNTSYKIVDIKYSGSKARRKGGRKGYLPLSQIEIVVEVGG